MRVFNTVKKKKRILFNGPGLHFTQDQGNFSCREKQMFLIIVLFINETKAYKTNNQINLVI